MPNLDLNAITKRLTRVTGINLMPVDVRTNDYKELIQSLYKQHFFKSFDPSIALSDFRISKTNINQLVDLLKKDNLDQFKKLHNLPMNGIGPGEITLYLITKTGRLGGTSTAGYDLMMNSGKKYEVKAVIWKSVKSKTYVSDMRLGGNISGMTHLESDLQKAFHQYGYTSTPNSPEIRGELFQRFERDYPEEYSNFERRYQQLAIKYFGDKDVIFIQHNQRQPDFGKVIAIKQVKAKDIKMERYTNRSIKPLIYVGDALE